MHVEQKGEYPREGCSSQDRDQDGRNPSPTTQSEYVRNDGRHCRKHRQQLNAAPVTGDGFRRMNQEAFRRWVLVILIALAAIGIIKAAMALSQ